MYWAINAVLSSCARKTLFCYGNGKFRTGLKLASAHESFQRTVRTKDELFFFYVLPLQFLLPHLNIILNFAHW
jgi:hypothetical protein